jgi:uncharacterized Tic20 family protein
MLPRPRLRADFADCQGVRIERGKGEVPMPIEIACPSCKAKMKAPDGAEGKTVQCPGCGNDFEIPRTARAPEAKDPDERSQRGDDHDEPPRRSRRRPDRDERFQDQRGGGWEDEEEDDRPRRKSRKSAGPGEAPTAQERNDAVIFWVLALVFSPIGPVVWWLMKKEDSRFLDHQGKQWLNLACTGICVFVLLMTVCCLVMTVGWMLVAGGAVASASGSAAGGGGMAGGFSVLLLGGFFFLLLIAYGMVSLIYTIIALIKAQAGVWYRIPHTLRLFK